ncbi:MAG: GNAT family N-acetyltransferase [Bacteroidota bacterium]
MVKVIKADIQFLDKITPLFDAYRQFYQQESNLADAENFLKERLEKKESVIFLALEITTNEACGFVQIFPIFSSVSMKNAWLLNDLFVTEKHRRKGIASQLLQAAIQLGKENNAAFVMLETTVDNKQAQKSYAKNGFEQSGNHFYFHFLSNS